MITLLHKLVYSDSINRLLRPFSYASYKLTGKKLLAVSGKINIDTCGTSFALYANQTSHVAQHLYYLGPDSYEFTPLLAHLMQRSNVFFDIGSNIGYFSILAAKVNKKAQVFAFEPSTGSLHYLQMNKRVNQCDNIVIVPKAVSNTNEPLEFHEIFNPKYPWLKHNLNGSNSLTNEHMQANHKSYQVDVTTLSAVMKEYHLDRIDVIKLDTECTEHIIIENSIEEINAYQPIIISEIYGPIEDHVVALFKDQITDYSMFQYLHNENKLVPIENFKHIAEDDLNRNFVFCPNAKISLIERFLKEQL